MDSPAGGRETGRAGGRYVPRDDEGFRTSKATFGVYEDREGRWRWRLVHDNGNIIADGGEGYASRQKCERGLRSVKANASGAEIVEVDAPSSAFEPSTTSSGP